MESEKGAKKGFSRRDFIKTTTAGVGGVALTGLGTGEARAAGRPEKWDLETDVVVVGCGGAGTTAAIAAHNAGAEVIIVEKAPEGGGNSRVGGSQFTYSTPELKDRAALYMYNTCNGTTPMDVCQAWADAAWTIPLLQGSGAMTKNNNLKIRERINLSPATLSLDSVFSILASDTDLPPWGYSVCGGMAALSGLDSLSEALGERALSMNRNPYTLLMMGKINDINGSTGAAVECFTMSLQLSEAYLEARLQRADCLWRMGAVQQALTDYRLLKELNYLTPAADFNLEWGGYMTTPASAAEE